MKFTTTVLFSAIQTIIKVASGFFANKIIALYTGPSGIALLGQFQNFITMLSSYASGASSTGVVCYTSKYINDNGMKHKIWSTAAKFCVLGSLVASMFLIIFRVYLATELLHNKIYSNVFIIIALSLIFYVASSFFSAIINGQHEIKFYTFVNSIGSLLGLFFSCILVIKYSIFGALCSLIISQSVLFFVIIIFIKRYDWFRWHYLTYKFDYVSLKMLLKYTIMSIASASIIPLSQIIIRNLIINDLSIDVAGNWQGLQRVSDAYLLIAYTAFGTYFLPKFASLNSRNEVFKELIDTYKIIIPFMLITTITIYLLRVQLVNVLFSTKFNLMPQMFFWQLCGDFFKIIAWPIGLAFMSKGKTLVIIINDLTFNILSVVLTYFLISIFSYQAPMISFMITYILWWLWLMYLFYRVKL